MKATVVSKLQLNLILFALENNFISCLVSFSV